MIEQVIFSFLPLSLFFSPPFPLSLSLSHSPSLSLPLSLSLSPSLSLPPLSPSLTPSLLLSFSPSFLLSFFLLLSSSLSLYPLSLPLSFYFSLAPIFCYSVPPPPSFSPLPFPHSPFSLFKCYYTLIIFYLVRLVIYHISEECPYYNRAVYKQILQ